MLDLAWLLFALPAAGMLVNMLLGGAARPGKTATGYVASGAIVASFLVSVGLFLALLGLDPEHRSYTLPLWSWITIGSLDVEVAMLIDTLSVTMALVVTGVGSLIHIYSIGYMHDDPRFQRFFVYLNFFVFAMLILVLSDNFLGMFVGWEGVGLASYLLIGFHFDRSDKLYGSYADAGKKAFLVNRIGDFGMLLAIMAIWTSLGTLNFEEVFANIDQMASGLLTVACLLLLLAATGKSAQLPLYVWLPDAMAGPTPVSALIHAATMVTAGVYLIARTHVMWEAAPLAANTVAWVGALTALFAASIAIVQVDLKKILAYSTISQLGYMMLGVGVGAYAFGIFHLITHAFFKGLLFLAAGNVMHALPAVGENERVGGSASEDSDASDSSPVSILDIRRMGNLGEKMPQTHLLFAIGALALAGFPLTSGYFSKDGILLNTFVHSPILYAIGIFTALLTAFYSFRAVFVSFWGEQRDQHVFEHAHESPAIMTAPLWILAGLALVGGLLNLPVLLTLEHWLEPSVGEAGFHPTLVLEGTLLAVSALVSLAGIGLAYACYVAGMSWTRGLQRSLHFVEQTVQKQWYVETVYNIVIVGPLVWLSKRFAIEVDQRTIDGAVNRIGQGHVVAGNALRRIHNGLVPTYALSLFVGVVVVILWFVVG